MRPSLAIFLSLALLSLIACSESKETRMQRFLIQGNEKIRQQEYEQAEKYFHSALKLDSCFADALNNLGIVEQRRQNLPGAIDYYSRAIACSTTFYLALGNRANAYFELNRHAEAYQDATVLVKQFPDSIQVLELLGLVEWKLDRLDKAAQTFNFILRKDPSNRNALVNVGSVYTLANHLDSAAIVLTRAQQQAPSDVMVLNALAILSSKSGDYNGALATIEKALVSRPDDAFTLNNKGYILLQLERWEEALEVINTSIATDPANGWAYRNKGIYCHQTGKLDDALRLFKQAERIDPQIEDLQLWLGKVQLKLGNNAEGCAYFRQVVQRKQLLPNGVPSSCQ
jgi:tetratricopeptide (TPR) repeat protein